MRLFNETPMLCYRTDPAFAQSALAEAIRMQRIDMMIDPLDVARRCGQTHDWFRQRELGKATITAFDLLIIAVALETRPDKLYEDAGLLPPRRRSRRE